MRTFALLVVILPIAVGAVLVAILIAVVRRPDPAPSDAAAAARRHSAVVNGLALTGLFGSIVVGLTLLSGPPTGLAQGLLLGLIPAAAGLAFAAVQAIGELTWPRPTGTLRRAPLTRRTAADVAPGWLRRVTWSWAALTAVLLVAFGAAADDGRQITRSFTFMVAGDPESGSSGAGPFPGWFYGIPLLAATAVVLLAAEGVLRLIARRPAVMDAAPEWDLGLRRVSARRLLRGVQLVLGWTATGVLFVAGTAVHRVGTGGSVDGISTASAGYAATGIALMLGGVAVWIASTAVMFLPGTAGAAEVAAAPSPENLDGLPA